MRINPFWYSVATVSTKSILGILTGALLLVGCGFDFDIPTADELVRYLDRLEFGPEWDLQSEEVVESGCEITETCPRAVRVYRVEASEFPSSVSILQEAGLKTEQMFQSCIDAPHEGCRALGWDEDVAIRILIASEMGSEVEVQVHASETVGAPTD
jgi:hypothetical protein